ncbi:MAG: putative transporter extracellular solute binding protein, partial [Thermomicrobiales bacterium]|nr:putative transporter extracellular solute binding protein [Thermomicrobiales bacterium]
MQRISRRRLVASGLVLPSSAYLSNSGILPAAAAPILRQEDVAEATLNPDVTSGKELYLLCWDSYKSAGMETWMPDFEAEMGGRVILDKVASNSLQDKQIVSLSGQTGEYDLMTVDEPYMPAYSPYLMDLTPLIERDGFPVDDWVPIMWDAGVYEGKVYAIPFDPNVQILYYRQDLLDALEIPV